VCRARQIGPRPDLAVACRGCSWARCGAGRAPGELGGAIGGESRALVAGFAGGLGVGQGRAPACGGAAAVPSGGFGMGAGCRDGGPGQSMVRWGAPQSELRCGGVAAILAE
jgi:hypothetical protein